jgi:hypothetical protein
VSLVTRILTSGIAAIAVIAHAAGEELHLEYSTNITSTIQLPDEGKYPFWERLKFEFDERAVEVFADRFHPFTVMDWQMDSVEREPSYFRDYSTRKAVNAFSRSITYSLREAAVELPIMSWITERQSILGNLLWNTVDDVGEESVDPLNPSFGLAERSWWKRMSATDQLRFGIRPLRTDPYAFMSFNVKDSERLLMVGHVRYRLMDFADHKFELAVSLPIAPGVALDLGTSYQLGQREDARKLVVKLFKEFKSGGIMHMGMELRERPTFLAGLAIPW